MWISSWRTNRMKKIFHSYIVVFIADPGNFADQKCFILCTWVCTRVDRICLCFSHHTESTFGFIFIDRVPMSLSKFLIYCDFGRFDTSWWKSLVIFSQRLSDNMPKNLNTFGQFGQTSLAARLDPRNFTCRGIYIEFTYSMSNISKVKKIRNFQSVIAKR